LLLLLPVLLLHLIDHTANVVSEKRNLKEV
jgi:hypothetical protein